MKKLVVIVSLALALTGATYGQSSPYITVTASNIQDASGAPLANGLICFQGVGTNGLPIPYRAGGPGGQRVNSPACRQVTNGVMPGTPIADSAFTSPANVAYTITIKNMTTLQTVLIEGPTQISCSTTPLMTEPCNSVSGGTIWNYDLFVPSSTPLAVVQSGPQGLKGDTGQAAVVTSNGSNGDFAIGGRMIATKGPWVDPLSKGAKCDGSTDDTAAFNSAITAAKADHIGTVLIPSGTCIITATSGAAITLDGTVALRGIGPASNKGAGSVLKFNSVPATPTAAIAIALPDYTTSSQTLLSDFALISATTPNANAVGVFLGGDPNNQITQSANYSGFQSFSNLFISGFSAGVRYGNNAYGNSYYNVNLEGNAYNFDTQAVALSNTGQTERVFGGIWSSATIAGLRSKNAEMEFYGTHFEYNCTGVLMLSGSLTMYSAHFETENESCGAFVHVPSTGGWGRLKMVGGTMGYHTGTMNEMVLLDSGAISTDMILDDVALSTLGTTLPQVINNAATNWGHIEVKPHFLVNITKTLGGTVNYSSQTVTSSGYTYTGQPFDIQDAYLFLNNSGASGSPGGNLMFQSASTTQYQLGVGASALTLWDNVHGKNIWSAAGGDFNVTTGLNLGGNLTVNNVGTGSQGSIFMQYGGNTQYQMLALSDHTISFWDSTLGKNMWSGNAANMYFGGSLFPAGNLNLNSTGPLNGSLYLQNGGATKFQLLANADGTSAFYDTTHSKNMWSGDAVNLYSGGNIWPGGGLDIDNSLGIEFLLSGANKYQMNVNGAGTFFLWDNVAGKNVLTSTGGNLATSALTVTGSVNASGAITATGNLVAKSSAGQANLYLNNPANSGVAYQLQSAADNSFSIYDNVHGHNLFYEIGGNVQITPGGGTLSFGGGSAIASSSNVLQSTAGTMSTTCTVGGYINVVVNGTTFKLAVCN